MPVKGGWRGGEDIIEPSYPAHGGIADDDGAWREQQYLYLRSRHCRAKLYPRIARADIIMTLGKITHARPS